jgi:hypothetical protein
MSGIFGGDEPQQQVVQAAAPTIVAPPPNRSDSQTQGLAERQRNRFRGRGSATRNYLAGAGASEGVSTTARTLGGT